MSVRQADTKRGSSRKSVGEDEARGVAPHAPLITLEGPLPCLKRFRVQPRAGADRPNLRQKRVPSSDILVLLTSSGEQRQTSVHSFFLPFSIFLACSPDPWPTVRLTFLVWFFFSPFFFSLFFSRLSPSSPGPRSSDSQRSTPLPSPSRRRPCLLLLTFET